MVLLLALGLASCSDTTPTVTALESVSSPAPVIKTQSTEFVEAHAVGSKRLLTTDLYSAQIKVHSGQALNHLETADQYRMTIRGVSF